jgi:PTS system glucose-specific IIC component
MWRTARPEHRAKVGGIMISAALTSFLTGITEPIEFAFIFVAPVLYALHALLAGLAYFVSVTLGIRHGTTFSHGLIDYVVLYANSTRGWWLLWLGPAWAAMYFVLFRTIILRAGLKTPGRELDDVAATGEADTNVRPRTAWRGASSPHSAARATSAASTRASPASAWSCRTCRRPAPRRSRRSAPRGWSRWGAGCRRSSARGRRTSRPTWKSTCAAAAGSRRRRSARPAPASAAEGVAVTDGHRARATAITAALGGAENVERVEAVAITRVRVELRDPAGLDEAALARAGARGVMRLGVGVAHVIVGEDAGGIAAAMHERTPTPAGR